MPEPEGQTGKKPTIERFKPGDKERTARHADVMNEIIDKLNTLLAIQVVPGDAGEFFYSDGNIVFLSSGGCGSEAPPADGTFVCGSIDGVKQWIETEQCGDIDGGDA